MRPVLLAYLAEMRHRPFRLGDWDCLIFTNTAWRLMHGRGFADDWLARYHRGARLFGRAVLAERFGFGSLHEALSSRLKPVEGVPPFGSLVTAPGRGALRHGLGLALGARAAFLHEEGMVQIDIGRITGAWVEV